MSFDLWISLFILFASGGLTPGPAVMLVLASAFRYGFRPAMRVALGIATANVFWLLLAVSGAAAILTQFPSLLWGMKILGFLVILYLASSVIFGPLPNFEGTSKGAPARDKLFSKGLLLQLSSPMPLVYFGLLLPTYVDPEHDIPTQFAIMLLTVTVTELAGLAIYAGGANRIRRWMSNPNTARFFNIIIGLVMIMSGVWAIFLAASR